MSFLDKDLKFPQPMRANIAFDRVLPFNLVGSLEFLYSKTLNQLFFINRNITPTGAKDKFGRVMYGTMALTGVPSANRPPLVTANGGPARFSSAIDVENQNKDYAYNFTTQLRKRYSAGWEALVAYNYGRAYDIQSFSSSTHISNWQFGRTLFTAQEVPGETQISLFDQPHKLTAFVTKTMGWGRLIKSSWASGLATDVTVSYVGVSGAPHDYVYTGAGGRGDLNADANNANDLIYIPTDVNDVTQIRWGANVVPAVGDTLTAALQAAAFNQFIDDNECLRKQRGQIMKRNSCRLPFSNQFDLSIRQNIPLVSSEQRVSVQLDIFNFGNLLKKTWGQQPISPLSGNSNVPLLTHTAESSVDPTVGVPTVQFNYRPLDPTKSGTIEAYQLGNFVGNYWRAQLSARVSF